MTKIKSTAPIIFLTIFFTFIFFYRLDYNTLASWDEAWYASIAREIIRTGNFMQMMWNGKPFYDHPPMGFWLMALSYKIFGINEFSTRFPSALLGVFSILLMYKIGTELFVKRIIGFVSALILGTSVWYVIRVRSGNLDSVFVFFYILTVYLSVKSSKNFNWFPLAMLSFGALVLSKTLVGVSALALILYLNFRQLVNVKKNLLLVLLGIWLFILAVIPWYDYHIKNYQDFIEYHFIHKGTRNKELSTYFHPMFEQPLFYLHMGVRKWYYIWLASLGFLLISFKFVRKNIFFLFLWNFIVLYPFMTSKEMELWHLIPAYLPLSLIVGVGVYEGVQLVNHILEQIMKRHPDLVGIVVKNRQRFWTRSFHSLARMTKTLPNIIYLILFLYIAFLQIKIFYKEVFPESRYITDQVDIARKLSKYDQNIFLDIDYLPVAVFYSGKHIETLVYEASAEATFTRLFKEDNGKAIGVTKNWVTEDLEKKKFPFKLLEKNNTYSIFTKP